MNRNAPVTVHDASGEPDLPAIIAAYHGVTEQLRQTHEQLETEVRRLTDELERKNQELARTEQLAALGEVAAGLAHEIRNPLAGLRLFAALLTQPQTTPEEVRKLAGNILEGLSTLESTVDDILVFARQGGCRPGLYPLPQLLTEAAHGVQLVAEQRRVRVEVDVDGAPETVWADRIQLLRALANLLNNAMEASQPNQRLIVSARPGRQDARCAEICVEDQGPGVPRELRRQIFDPFYTTKATGTGLGLPIVQRIVANHGGILEVQDADGGGASFCMTLPPSPVPAEAEHQEWHASA
jgi:signal transduction histidine kinase